MKNKTILITGCSSGVGKMLALELSKGNRVIAIARREEKLKELFVRNTNVTLQIMMNFHYYLKKLTSNFLVSM